VDKFSLKSQIPNFTKIFAAGVALIYADRQSNIMKTIRVDALRDGQTDMMKLIVFRRFRKTAKRDY
jgi:hypothetical protein